MWKHSPYTYPDEIFAWLFWRNGQKPLAKRSDLGSHTLETDVDAIDYAADLIAGIVADRKIQQGGLNAGMT